MKQEDMKNARAEDHEYQVQFHYSHLCQFPEGLLYLKEHAWWGNPYWEFWPTSPSEKSRNRTECGRLRALAWEKSRAFSMEPLVRGSKRGKSLVSDSQREGISGSYLTDTATKRKRPFTQEGPRWQPLPPRHLILTLSVPSTILS